MFNYMDIKEKLAFSREIALVVDSWKKGVPFYVEYKGELCDAFMFYSDNRKQGIYYKTQCLILIGMDSGNVSYLDSDTIKSLYHTDENISTGNFVLNANYFEILSQIEKTYCDLRNNTHVEKNFEDIRDEYLSLLNSAVPKSVIDGVYAKINPKLFGKR